MARHVPRLKSALPIHLQDGWRGEVADVSANGLRVRCLAVLSVGTPVEGVIEYDGRRVAVRGVVAWQTHSDFARRKLGEVGIDVREASDEYRRLVAELFAEDG